MTDDDLEFADLDTLIGALYASISGDAGVPRDWATQARIFHPDARLVRTGWRDDGPTLQVMTPERYRENVTPFFATHGFHEIETARRVQRFGNFAHVMSAYEARVRRDDPMVERRGINSIQCFHDGRRWWVMNMIWDNERNGLEIPGDWFD